MDAIAESPKRGNANVIKYLCQNIHEKLPAGWTRMCAAIRRMYLPLLLGKTGQGLFVVQDVQFRDPQNMFFGDFCQLGPRCVLDACGNGSIELGDHVVIRRGAIVDAGENGIIKIGNGVGIGPGCYLRSSSHIYDDPDKPYRALGHRAGFITLEADVWLAASVCVLPNTYLEKGCIVAPGSVVSGRYKAYSIIAGNPGRVVGQRGNVNAAS